MSGRETLASLDKKIEVLKTTLIGIDGRYIRKEYFTNIISIGLLTPGQYILKVERKNQKPVFQKVII